MDERAAEPDNGTSAQAADPLLTVLDAAHSILSFHVAGPDGFCAGCIRQWNRLTHAPCEQARWAILVVETHGVARWSFVGRAAA